eukprot:Clim_evm59s109 gene=Clim_evmTU59s109
MGKKDKGGSAASPHSVALDILGEPHQSLDHAKVLAAVIERDGGQISNVNVNPVSAPGSKFQATLGGSEEVYTEANAVVMAILQGHTMTAVVDQLYWSVWEANQLLPAVVNNDGIALEKCVKHFEQKYLSTKVGRSVVVDIIVGSTLRATKAYMKKATIDKHFTKGVTAYLAELTKSGPIALAATHVLFNDAALMRKSLVPGAGVEQAEVDDLTVKVDEAQIEAAKKAWESKDTTPAVPEEVHPILPVKGRRNVMVTSALPYVNNVPHLGNVIGCVLSADVYARFCRNRGYNTIYICGTDEYGTATETKALQEGLTPQEICDKYHALHKKVYDWFNISFTLFGRTTTPQQTEIAQDIFKKLRGHGHLTTDSMEQLKCLKDDKFLADRFVEGTCPKCGYDDARGDQCDKCSNLLNATELIKPRCKICGSAPVVQQSKHLFLDLPSIEQKLEAFLDQSIEEGKWSTTAQAITRSWLKMGLQPRCITRDLKWGTPLPDDVGEEFQNKVFYVWYDAPIGYPSITANYTDKWEEWWKNPENVELYQFMAKDNVPFHSVIFPSCLLGTNDGWTLLSHLNAVEYLNYEDTKFSKSRGIGVFGTDAEVTGVDADVFRYYLLSIRPEGADSAFTWSDFQSRNNGELLNNLGNFVNRAISFTASKFDGKVPEMKVGEQEYNLFAHINVELAAYVDNLETVKMRDALRNAMAVSRLGNQYLQMQEPWKTIKTDPERAGTTCAVALQLVHTLSSLIEPYMPTVAERILQQVNAKKVVVDKVFRPTLAPGHALGKAELLFRKIEDEEVKKWRDQFSGNEGDKKAPEVPKLEGQALEDAIAAQGNKVRELKTQKAEKDVIDAEVKILLGLKAQLPGAGKNDKKKQKGGDQKQVKNPSKKEKKANGKTPAPSVIPDNVPPELAQKIEAQGTKIRELKAAKADPTVIKGEVQILLALKEEAGMLPAKK